MRAKLLAVALVSIGACKESPPDLKGPAVSSVTPSVIPLNPVAPPTTSEAPDKDKYPLSDEQIAKIVNPTGATEYAGATGVIEGVITVKGDPSPRRPFVPLPKGCDASTNIHGDVYRAGPKGELSDALVAIIGVGGYVRPSRDDKKVVIHDCAIDPTVIDLSLGQRLLVGNSDVMPYTPQIPGRVIVQRVVIKDMSPVPMFFTQPGVFGMTWLAGALPGSAVPTATVFVLPSALHAVTPLDGKFRITGVPAGKAVVAVSHLDMDEVKKEVEVKAGGELKVEITLTYKAPRPAPSTSASGPKPVPSIR